MVKPTIGICCEIAQKHGSEFVQIFFEKAIDKSIRRVYNGIVPGKTGTKKRRCNKQQNGGNYEQQHFYGAESTPCWN